MSKQRMPYLTPPRYDIDALLSSDYTDLRTAMDIVDRWWGAIDEDVPKSEEYDFFRPDSALLYPEMIVRDLCRFQTTMNNGVSQAHK